MILQVVAAFGEPNRRGRASGLAAHRQLLVALSAAALVRVLWLVAFMRGEPVEAYGMEYLRLAAILLQRDAGSGLVDLDDAGFVAPLFPALIAGAGAVAQDSLSLTGLARVVSIIFGASVTLPVYGITLLMYGRRAAVLAAWCVAAHPLLIKASTNVAPEAVYVACLLAGTWCIMRSWSTNSRLIVAGAGVLLGLTVLTRVEAWPCAIVAMLALELGTRRRWRERARRVAVFSAGFLLTVAPVLALSVQDATARSLADHLFQGQHAFRADRVALQLGTTVRAVGMLGWPIAFVCVVGGFLSRQAAVPAHVLLLAMVSAIALGLGASWPPALFSVVLIAITSVWASGGLGWLADRIQQVNLWGVGPIRWATVLPVVLVSSVSAVSAAAVLEEGRASADLWQAGWWLGTVRPLDKRIMDTSMMLSFHAGGRHVSYPRTDSRAALGIIDRQAVDYLVVRAAPAGPAYLREWLDNGVPDRRAVLVHAAMDKSAAVRMAIYKWNRNLRGDVAEAGNRPTTGTAVVAPVSTAGPLRVSPRNPRYFADKTGRTVYLTSSHTWPNFQDASRIEPPATFDFDQYLNFLQAHRFNFIRLWTWEQANWAPWRPYDFSFSPLPYVREGPALARDRKPRFNLTRPNIEYFRRLRERVQAARMHGVYVGVMLFQGWSVGTKGQNWRNPWEGHPFHRDNNVNGIDGDPQQTGSGSSIHSLGDPAVVGLQERYVEQVLNTLNDLDNVLFEICNECDATSVRWQYHMIDLIRRLEAQLPNQHPIGMTAVWPAGRNADLMSSPADWVSPNSAGGYAKGPPAADGSKVILLDTDHLWGIGGSAQWVWKSFLSGMNPIFMDPYDHAFYPGAGFLHGPSDRMDARWAAVRVNMRYTSEFAARVDLTTMVPAPHLASSGYCLARTAGPSSEYLIYAPSGSSVVVDLTSSSGELAVEWFTPEAGITQSAGTVKGGARVTVRPPVRADAVLHIHRKADRVTNGGSHQ